MIPLANTVQTKTLDSPQFLPHRRPIFRYNDTCSRGSAAPQGLCRPFFHGGGIDMSDAETAILKQFRLYQVQAREMLFINRGYAKAQSTQFARAMDSLIKRRLVIKERHRDAYSLTDRGYAAVQSS